jgi:hypothetical protein
MTVHTDLRVVAGKLHAIHPTSSLYFLLDHSGLPGLQKQLAKSTATWANLFEDTKERNALAVAPILILAAAGGDLRISRSLFDWVTHNGIYTSTVILISSPLDIEDIKPRLVKRLDVVLSENVEAMLRFFDPRVLECLICALSPEQVNQFFNVADGWWYFDRGGNMVTIDSSFSPEDSFVAPLVLSQEQESSLIEGSEVDQVMHLLKSNLPRMMQALTQPEQFEFVSHQIAVAKQLELESVWKMALYAAIVLSNGEKFLEGERQQRVLERLKKDDCEWSEEF